MGGYIGNSVVGVEHPSKSALNATTGDFTGAVDIDGSITSSAGATITTADNNAQLTLKSTDADASAGPLIKMHRDSSSPADGDALGRFNFIGENDASEEITYARIHAKASDVTDGTEDGQLLLLTTVDGTNRSRMAIGSSETVFNEDSIDLDFRVESNGNANMLVVDGGNDKVGIGTASPAVEAHIQTSSGNPELRIESTGANYATMSVKNSSRHYSTQIRTDQSNAYVVRDETAGANRFFIDTSGNVTMPSQPAFLAQPASNQEDITAGQNITVVLGTEVFDVGSNFASNTFTAPVTGKYLLIFTLYGSQLDGDASYMEIAIETSNRTYTTIQEPSGTEDVYAGGTTSAVADMDANDTAFVRVTTGSGQSTFDITTSSRFSGALIC